MLAIETIPESLTAFFRAGVPGIMPETDFEKKHKRTVRILVPESQWEPRHDKSNNNGGKVLFVKVSDELYTEMVEAESRYRAMHPHIYASLN